MRGELFKRQDRYDLYGSDGSKIASSSPNPFGKLSKENCDEIFSTLSIEEISLSKASHFGGVYRNPEGFSDKQVGYLHGFIEGAELNKDKLFTIEDIRKALSAGLSIGYGRQFEIENKSVEIDSYIQSLQQPTEIEVEIEMGGYKFNCDGEKYGFPDLDAPKLDENGCLILKKKI